MVVSLATSLPELLEQRAADGRCRYISHAVDGSCRELTSQDLWARATRASGQLAARLCGHGEPTGEQQVVLVIRDPLAFTVAFFAVSLAGLVPVPAPSSPGTHQVHLSRLRGIVEASDPVAVITDEDDLAPLLSACATGERPVMSLDEPEAAPRTARSPSSPAETAYVQYTSGSVTRPKPIRLRHGNVLSQLAQAAEAYDESGTSVSVNWVPLHHDMGLVTSVLRPLWSGYTSVMLDPMDFVRDPGHWLRAMTRWQATHTSAPDFGYGLCVRKVAVPEAFDLHALRVARSAGEPVREATLRAFAETFRPAGFNPRAFAPSYGLAEATLTVTTCPVAEPPGTVLVSRKALRAGLALPPMSEEDKTEIVSCGRPLRDTTVEIINPGTGRGLGPDRLGEIWISGPQVTDVDLSAHRLNGVAGHRTGDIGFVRDGELYLIGRAAERFQVAGENYYSGDVEHAAGTADARLRLGRVAAFLAHPDGWPDPGLVVVAEYQAGTQLDEATGAAICAAIRSTVKRALGLALRSVLLVRAGTLPVTSSGKLQRGRCRTDFEDGAIEAAYRAERSS